MRIVFYTEYFCNFVKNYGRDCFLLNCINKQEGIRQEW